MITTSKINEIVNKIAGFYHPDKIILFGSYAAGNPHEGSDLDLIVIKQTGLPRHQRGREIRKFLFGSLVPMDIKIYTPDEFNYHLADPYSFLNNAIKNSKVLYEQ